MNRAIDGLRATAVVAVMLYHCGAPLGFVGWLGVDLFFVLSGFLITFLLLAERRENGRISLRMFWARRFLRLMPIYVLYVSAISGVVLSGIYGEYNAESGWSPLLFLGSLWTYLHNYVPFGGIWSEQQLTRHLWSLAVEEQFYFLWPVLVVGMAGWRRLGVLIVVLSLLVMGANLLYYQAAPPSHELQSCVISMFAGCLMAVLLHGHAAWLERVGLLSASASWLSLGCLIAAYVGIGILMHYYGFDRPQLLAIGVPWFAAAAALLIANIWHEPKSAVGRMLSLGPLPRIGAVSYGIYLYHMVVLDVVWKGLLPDIEHWNRFAKFGLRVSTFLLLTYLVALASHRWIEQPFLRLKKRFRPRATEPVGSRT